MQQFSIFDFIDSPTKRFKISKNTPIRLIELFAGVGSQAMALKALGVNFEHYRVVEWDKYAVKSYNAIHGTSFTTTDIKEVKGEDLAIEDTEHFTYLLTYSFPCQDLSVAGKGRGMTKGTGTRSGLLWEVERLLNETKELPQILMMENVSQVHADKNMDDFKAWLDFLHSKGYSNFYEDLNAKDYGVAQSRERCICISLLGDWWYEFPETVPLDKKMKDYLEDKVDERFYLKNEKSRSLIDKLIKGGKILTDRQTDKQSNCQLIPSQSKHPTQSWQDRTEASQESVVKEPESVKHNAYMNYNVIGQIDNPVGMALCARDCRGFGTSHQLMNGVIECTSMEDRQI